MYTHREFSLSGWISPSCSAAVRQREGHRVFDAVDGEHDGRVRRGAAQVQVAVHSLVLRLTQHPHLVAPRFVAESEDRCVERLRAGDVVDGDLEMLHFGHGSTVAYVCGRVQPV